MNKIYVVGLLLCVFFITASTAQASGMLTREAIEEFYADSSEITESKSPEDQRFWLQKHLHDDVVLFSKSKLNINLPLPGARAYNKEEIIKATIKNAQRADVKVLKNLVTSFAIEQEGKTANTENYVEMTVTVGIKGKQFTVSTISICKDILILSPQNVLQLLKSNCEATTNIPIQ